MVNICLTSYFPLTTVLVVVAAFVALVAAYIWWKQQYWKRKNIPYLDPSFPLGHVQNPFVPRNSYGNHFRKFYPRIKEKGFGYCGIYLFASPVLYIVDPELLKYVLTTDFQYFTDHAVYYNERDDPLSAHLYALEGAKWYRLRHKLTAAFTSGKMKRMFQTVLDCQLPLTETVDGYCERQEPMDIKDIFSRFTTDIIGSCAFGFECNSFKDENSPFVVYGKKLLPRNWLRMFTFILSRTYPKLARALHIRDLPKEPVDFFFGIIKDTVEYREKNKVSRDDFFQILLELKNDPDSEKSLTLNEVAAQCLLFFAAGFETTSTTMTFAAYELAKNQGVQEKAREEINRVLGKNGNQISYDVISEMKYLGKIIDETLRRYPPGALVTRVCNKDYKFPGRDLTIEKGVTVLVPILGLHLDPDNFPDPLKFDPERFSVQNKSKIRPYTYLPFGEGPRNCIALRFALMETKVGLMAFLKNYKFTLNERTSDPLKMDPRHAVQSAEGGVWLNVEKVDDR